MQVIRQYDHRIDEKGMPLACVPDRVAQQVDVVYQKRLATVGEIDGEEVGGTGDEDASVVGNSLTSEMALMGIASLNPSYDYPLAFRRVAHCAQPLDLARALSDTTPA